MSSMALLLWHKRGRERLEKGETRRRGGQGEGAGGLAWRISTEELLGLEVLLDAVDAVQGKTDASGIGCRSERP